MSFRGTPLKNKELQTIYMYLADKITRVELSDQLGRTKTNSYYYIGRAVHYWLRTGVLKFHKVRETRNLGGRDINDNQEPKT